MRLRSALARLEDRKAHRLADRETAPIPYQPARSGRAVPKIDINKLDREDDKSILNNPAGSPRTSTHKGHFSRGVQTRNAGSPHNISSATKMTRRTSSPKRLPYGDNFQ